MLILTDRISHILLQSYAAAFLIFHFHIENIVQSIVHVTFFWSFYLILSPFFKFLPQTTLSHKMLEMILLPPTFVQRCHKVALLFFFFFFF